MSRRAAVWARVSTLEQKLDSQQDELERYVVARGWKVVRRFEEHGVSGAAGGRRVVDEVLEGARLRRFDVVVVFKTDRAFRSAGRACLLIDELVAHGVAFVSVKDGLDTSTPAGELLAKLVSILAEAERRAIKDRIRAGVEAARRRGRRLGRPRAHVDLGAAQEMLLRGISLRQAARKLGVSPRTLRRRIQAGQKPASRHAPQVPGTTAADEAPAGGGER